MDFHEFQFFLTCRWEPPDLEPMDLGVMIPIWLPFKSFHDHLIDLQTGEILEFFDFKVNACLRMDASAARAICRREGVGKIKHLDVKTLWLQQAVKLP